MTGAREFEDPVAACLVKTVKNARMTLSVLSDLKSIKAAGKPAIFFQDGLKNVQLNPSFHPPDRDFCHTPENS